MYGVGECQGRRRSIAVGGESARSDSNLHAALTNVLCTFLLLSLSFCPSASLAVPAAMQHRLGIRGLACPRPAASRIGSAFCSGICRPYVIQCPPADCGIAYSIPSVSYRRPSTIDHRPPCPHPHACAGPHSPPQLAPPPPTAPELPRFQLYRRKPGPMPMGTDNRRRPASWRLPPST